MSANFRAERRGDSVGRVGLRGALLDHNTAPELGRVDRIVKLGVIRVNGMCIVGRNQKAVCNELVKINAERFREAFQRVAKEDRTGSLLGVAPNFFIVKGDKTVERIFGVFCRKKTLQSSVSAHEVINARRGEKRLVCAPDTARGAVVKEEVGRADRIHRTARRLCKQLFECSFCVITAEERLQIDCRVQGDAFVDLAVLVNGNARNE